MKIMHAALLAALGLPLVLLGGDSAIPPSGKDIVTVPDLWTLPLWNSGVRTNDEYTDLNMSLTLPVWSTIGRDGRLGGDYVFLEPYVSMSDGGETAASLGIAWGGTSSAMNRWARCTSKAWRGSSRRDGSSAQTSLWIT